MRHRRAEGDRAPTEQADVALRWTEQGFGQGRLEVADELVAEDFVNHNAIAGQDPGREGLKAAVAMLRGAFADLSVSVEDVIAEGNRVVIRDTITGTHQGPFAGLRPTGRKVRVPRIGIFHVLDGQIKEYWGLFDMFGVMQQLRGAPDDRAARFCVASLRRGVRDGQVSAGRTSDCRERGAAWPGPGSVPGGPGG